MTGDPGAAHPPNRAVHWLLFDHTPTPPVLEALVVSRELGVTWVDERTLGWQPGVLLQGPLTEAELDDGAELPDWVECVYAVLTPRERGPAVPPELQLPGSVLTAFPDGEPAGVERAALVTVEAVARRLGGAVVTEDGHLVVPEPRVDLVLFTTTWLEEEELRGVLASIAPVEAGGGRVLPPGVEEQGYGLVADLGSRGVLSVTTSPADVTPISLAGYGWAAGRVYVYEIRHYAAQRFSFQARPPVTPAEAEALVDDDAAALVDAAATAVLAAVGGVARAHLCDDDGFLVELQ